MVSKLDDSGDTSIHDFDEKWRCHSVASGARYVDLFEDHPQASANADVLTAYLGWVLYVRLPGGLPGGHRRVPVDPNSGTSHYPCKNSKNKITIWGKTQLFKATWKGLGTSISGGSMDWGQVEDGQMNDVCFLLLRDPDFLICRKSFVDEDKVSWGVGWTGFVDPKNNWGCDSNWFRWPKSGTVLTPWLH